MRNYERQEIRRRALRAAAAVAVCLGGPGCGGEATSVNPQATDGAVTAADGQTADLASAADAAGNDTAAADAAGTDTDKADADKTDVAQAKDSAADAADVAGSDVLAADAGPDLASADTGDANHKKCDIASMDDQTYADCCKSVNWDWNQGCMAWGPPAPPVMPVRSEVA